MHRVHPTLKVTFGMPSAHDVVAVLVELHVQAKGIVGCTTEAVVFRMPFPRVNDFLHSLSYLRIYGYYLTTSGVQLLKNRITRSWL